MWFENSYWEFMGDKSLPNTLISPLWDPIQILRCAWAQNSTMLLSLVLPVTDGFCHYLFYVCLAFSSYSC